MKNIENKPITSYYSSSQNTHTSHKIYYNHVDRKCFHVCFPMNNIHCVAYKILSLIFFVSFMILVMCFETSFIHCIQNEIKEKDSFS